MNIFMMSVASRQIKYIDVERNDNTCISDSGVVLTMVRPLNRSVRTFVMRTLRPITTGISTAWFHSFTCSITVLSVILISRLLQLSRRLTSLACKAYKFTCTISIEKQLNYCDNRMSNVIEDNKIDDTESLHPTV